jgi:hypothetical protein
MMGRLLTGFSPQRSELEPHVRSVVDKVGPGQVLLSASLHHCCVRLPAMTCMKLLTDSCIQ